MLKKEPIIEELILKELNRLDNNLKGSGFGGDENEAPVVGQDYHNADLRGVDWIGCNLTGCNFLDADFGSADLEYVYGTGVIFEGAKMEQTNLRGAHLPGANFRVSTLKQA